MMKFFQGSKTLINNHKHLITSDQQDNESYSFELDQMSLPSDVLEDKRSRAGERNNQLGYELKPDHVMKSYRSYTAPTRQIDTQNNEVNDN